MRVRAQIPQEVVFAHPLVRAAVYDDLSLRRRRDLQLAWARLTSGAASLAHHVAASEGGDDALAAELAETAEGEVAAGALAAGIDHLLWGSRVAASRCVREAALTASAGRLADAEAELRRVIARPDFAAHPELFGPVTSSLAMVCAYAGRGTDAFTWAHRALDTEAPRTTDTVTAKQALALGLGMAGRGGMGSRSSTHCRRRGSSLSPTRPR